MGFESASICFDWDWEWELDWGMEFGRSEPRFEPRLKFRPGVFWLEAPNGLDLLYWEL